MAAIFSASLCICICIWWAVFVFVFVFDQIFVICVWNPEKNVFVFVFDKNLTPALVFKTEIREVMLYLTAPKLNHTDTKKV